MSNLVPLGPCPVCGVDAGELCQRPTGNFMWFSETGIKWRGGLYPASAGDVNHPLRKKLDLLTVAVLKVKEDATPHR